MHRFPFPPLPPGSPIKAQLDRILDSRAFSSSRRSQLFLRYILHHAIAHPNEQPKEYSIALDVFDRDASYDPAVNNTVRVAAGRLRSRLLEYYAGEGAADPLLFNIPKGSYRVLMQPRNAERPAAVRPAQPARLRQLWAIPLALLIGVIFGYRISR